MDADSFDPFIIVDAHQDIAYNAITYGRNFTHSARLKRELERDSPFLEDSGVATIGLPDALLGRVGIIFGTLFVRSCSVDLGIDPCYEQSPHAHMLALSQLQIYQQLAAANERIRLVSTQADLEAVLATWAEGVLFADHQVGIVLAMEGADPIQEPYQFGEWYMRGVRSVGLSWVARSRYAGGNGQPGPLTEAGRDLLDVMARFQTILDLSHASNEAALAALDRYCGPIIASHSNPRRFCDTERHLPDETIRRIAEHDGVIGAVINNKFLRTGWSKTDPKLSLDQYIAVIDYVCQLTGSARHVGIGSDMDGGFGYDSIPAELDTVSDLHYVGVRLEGRGYGQDDIRAILGGNFLRILRAALPV